MSIIEAVCTRCGEIFIPNDCDDMEHIERNDGTPCEGEGVVSGIWRTP